MVGVSLNGAGIAGLPVLKAAEAGLRAWPKGLLVSRIELLKETDALSHLLIGKPALPVCA